MQLLRKHALVDGLLFALAIWTSYTIRLGFPAVSSAYRTTVWQAAILAAALKPSVVWAMGIYRIYWRYSSAHEWRRLLLALAVASIALTFAILALRSLGLAVVFPRSIIVVDLAVSLIFIGFYRKALGGFGARTEDQAA